MRRVGRRLGVGRSVRGDLRCAGATRDTCTGTLGYDFTSPITNGLAAEGGSAFFSAGCTLVWERDEATLAADELHFHSLENRAVKDIAEAACTLDAARALTGPCVYQVDVVGARLQAADSGSDAH